MALNTSKCSHLTPLRFKGLKRIKSICQNTNVCLLVRAKTSVTISRLHLWPRVIDYGSVPNLIYQVASYPKTSSQCPNTRILLLNMSNVNVLILWKFLFRNATVACEINYFKIITAFVDVRLK